MKRQTLLMRSFLAISFLIVLTACGTPAKIIKGNTLVDCTWPDPPVLSITPPDATVGKLIQNLLSDKNVLIDYAAKVMATKKCYEDTLGKQ